MDKIITFLTFAVFSFSVFSQENEHSRAQAAAIKGIKETEIAKRASAVAQDEAKSMINKDIVSNSAIVMALASQKFHYKKDAYALDVDLKNTAISVGVKYEF